MEQLKEITQKPQMRPFIKKVYESVLKYVLLNSTLNRDVCKRTCYNPFNPVLTGLFRVLFRLGSAKLHLRSLFLMLQPQIHIPSCTFFKLTKLTSAFFITLVTKISKIASNGGILLKHQEITE